MFDEQKELAHFPETPGVYIMKDRDQKVIYIGKAIHLKNRVKQYFGASADSRPFVALLPTLLSKIEFISTETEKDALILERNLILKHKPPFNISLKFNDKQFYIKIDLRQTWPKLEVIRTRLKEDQPHKQIRFFGPYLSAWDLKMVMRQVERFFQIRNCEDIVFKNRTRPCLQYQIKRCSAPCYFDIPREEYMVEVDQAMNFLSGDHQKIIETLKQKMFQEAEREEYERAAYYRDQINAIIRALEPQQVSNFTEDLDSIGFYREEDEIQLIVLEVRNGALINSIAFEFNVQYTENEELLKSFICLYYPKKEYIPQRIDLPFVLSSKQELQSAVNQIFKEKGIDLKPIKFNDQPKDQYLKLNELAHQNAVQILSQRIKKLASRNAVLELYKLLKLKQIPNKIECYDISLIQGDAPVGSQVVFVDGKPHKQAYRIRHIQTVSDKNDDFLMMREVLMRRLLRFSDPQVLGEGEEINDDDIMPDLLVIDGGKGQLRVAVSVLDDLGLSQDIEVISLAKARHKGGDIKTDERVFLVNKRDGIALKPQSLSFKLLTQLRDEAHRFALNAHRKLRSKNRLENVLFEIKGLGPVKRKRLFEAFMTMEGIKQATIMELLKVKGIDEQLAGEIYRCLHG